MYNIVCLATASTEVEEFVQNPGVVKTYLDKYTPAIIGFLVQIIVAIIVLLVGIKIIKSVVKVIKKGFDKSHIDDGVGTFLTSLIKYALYFILVMAILSSFGIATGSVVAVLGSAGLTIGMALQGSLSNFAGGVLILLLKPFVLGDYIIDDTTGEEGTVSNISIFYTRLKTIDNKVVLIPNGKLSDSCITNVSMMEKRRIDIYVTVSYSADLQKTKNVLNNVAISQVLRLEGEPIDIFVSELKDSAVEMGIRVWAKNEDYWNAKNVKIFGADKIVGLFDYDQEGSEKFYNLKEGFQKNDIQGNLEKGFYRKKNIKNCNKDIYAAILPIPKRLYPLINHSSSTNPWSNGGVLSNFVEIETLLDKDFLSQNKNCLKEESHGHEYYLVNDKNKEKFWHDLVDQPSEIFTDFIPLFNLIHKLLGIDKFM